MRPSARNPSHRQRNSGVARRWGEERGDGGFTLLELLIVIAIIGILFAVALPSLLRSRITANHTATVGNLHTIYVANVDYNTNSPTHTYADTLSNLAQGKGAGEVPYLTDWIINGNTSERSGYTISYSSLGRWKFAVRAEPILPGTTGFRHFYLSENGQVCQGEQPCLGFSAVKPCGTCSPLD